MVEIEIYELQTMNYVLLTVEGIVTEQNIVGKGQSMIY